MQSSDTQMPIGLVVILMIWMTLFGWFGDMIMPKGTHLFVFLLPILCVVAAYSEIIIRVTRNYIEDKFFPKKKIGLQTVHKKPITRQ